MINEYAKSIRMNGAKFAERFLFDKKFSFHSLENSFSQQIQLVGSQRWILRQIENISPHTI